MGDGIHGESRRVVTVRLQHALIQGMESGDGGANGREGATGLRWPRGWATFPPLTPTHLNHQGRGI